MALKTFELDTSERNVDAVDSVSVIQPIMDMVPREIVAYTVGSEAYSLTTKLNEIHKTAGPRQYETHTVPWGKAEHRHFQTLVKDRKLVAIADTERCRVLVYVLREYLELFLPVVRALQP